MQQKIDLSREALEFIDEIKNTAEVGTVTKTVEELYDMYTEGRIYKNTDYNREYSWTPAIYKSYEFSMVKKSVIPAVIVRKVKWKGSFRYEIIDGGHRVETPVKCLNNEIRLPDSILKELGGGGYYKDAHKEIRKAIRQAKIILFDLGFISDEEVSRIFCSLQNGQKLKSGQQVKGMQYGINAPCINKGLKSRLWNNLSDTNLKNGLHYSIIVQAMRFEDSLNEHGRIPLKKDYLKFVERNDLPTDKVLINNVVALLNKLSDVLEGTVSNVRLQSLIRGEVWFLFIRQHEGEPIRTLSEFFDIFYGNIAFVRDLNDDDRTKEMVAYHNFARLKYEDILPFMEFFNKKFDLFKKGELDNYNQTKQTRIN